MQIRPEYILKSKGLYVVIQKNIGGDVDVIGIYTDKDTADDVVGKFVNRSIKGPIQIYDTEELDKPVKPTLPEPYRPLGPLYTIKEEPHEVEVIIDDPLPKIIESFDKDK
jgi:hypothetical protein